MATTVALGIAASPAAAQEAGAPSAAGVVPTVTDNGTTCGDIVDDPTVFEVSPNQQNVPVEFTPGGTITLTFPTADEINFSITGPYAARAAIIVGEDSNGDQFTNQFVYDSAAGFPHGIASDEALHAPLDQTTGQNDLLDDWLFCIIPSAYNGTSQGR
ncbi:hypothetical protein AB0N17_45910 [Streptomyces sp. NPDC051133]|uniref:hypothetical protein n=1 Tax=Streptomyces sp. NPDC051133 TaxID=3155521 RepID=UPI00342DEB3D